MPEVGLGWGAEACGVGEAALGRSTPTPTPSFTSELLSFNTEVVDVSLVMSVLTLSICFSFPFFFFKLRHNSHIKCIIHILFRSLHFGDF